MATVKFYEPVMDRMLNQPGGMVGQYMNKIGVLIMSDAIKMAGKDSRELVSKMFLRHSRRGKFQYIQVGSTAGHALVHHTGAKPHQILPQTGRVLRFNVGGSVVYARKVAHPGHKPNPYLTVPMRRHVRGG